MVRTQPILYKNNYYVLQRLFDGVYCAKLDESKFQSILQKTFVRSTTGGVRTNIFDQLRSKKRMACIWY